MIKFHVVKEAKEAVLYFVQDFDVNFTRERQYKQKFDADHSLGSKG